MDRSALLETKEAFSIMKRGLDNLNAPLPVNGKNLRLRKLDCAVFQFLHKIREDQNLPPYDSVRGLFFEGGPLYPMAGIADKDHIQICVRNPGCILGFFLPIEG